MTIHQESRHFAKLHIAETILAALYMEGKTRIIIPREQIEDEIWRDLIIKTSEDFDTRSLIVTFAVRGIKPNVTNAEYEIIEEPQALPSPPKQLPSGENQNL